MLQMLSLRILSARLADRGECPIRRSPSRCDSILKV